LPRIFRLFFWFTHVDISKICAIFKSVWVRKLTGKLGVPSNRRLRVRGSLRPHRFDAGLSLVIAKSNVFHIHSIFTVSTQKIDRAAFWKWTRFHVARTTG
jgi:hypothetical protein